MFKIIRCGFGYGLVIVVSPPDADVRTPGAKFYRFADWQIYEHEPWVFNEISADVALGYFSGIADGLGFEIVTTDTFPSLEATLEYVKKKNEEHLREMLKKIGKTPEEIEELMNEEGN